MSDTQHVHTSTCWQERGERDCYEFRILQLETALAMIQAGLRELGGSTDKMEAAVKRTLQEKPSVVK